MTQTPASHPLRIFWLSIALTIIIGAIVTANSGISGLWLFVILLVLEVTFSFDNAVINSKVLARMSPIWQKLFLTVGIIVAVFIVRFLLPIIIVMLATQLGFTDVLNLALHEPEHYGKTLHAAAPMIDAFGGAFLIMIGISYFMDRHKDIHWLKRIEQHLAAAGRFENLKVLVMLIVAILLYSTVDRAYHVAVLVASILGIMLHMALDVMGGMFAAHQSNAKQLIGWAAFASFVYLEVLDASFSFDGVIGAFAITNSVLLIIAGLGAGAIWVRSLTVYLLRAGTLSKYRYLEHGAHWAILALGLVMFIKLYHITPPDWMTGSLGIVFIGTAIVSSILERRHTISSE